MDEIKIKDIAGITYDKGKMYIIPSYIPAIIEYDFLTKKVEKICNYPRAVMNQFFAFERIIKCDSKIYLFPCLSDKIYCYDIGTGKYKELLALGSIADNLPRRKCFDVIKNDKYIYAVCICPNFVMQIDTSNDDIQVWKPDYKELGYDDTINYPFFACIHDDKLIYPYSSNLKIEFCISDKTFSYVNLIGHENNYDNKVLGYLRELIINNAGKCWTGNMYGELFEIDGIEMKKIEIPVEAEGVYDDGVSKEISKTNKIILNNDKLYFLLNCDNRILGYDMVSKETFWIENPFSECKAERRKLAYSVYAPMDKDLFLLFNYNEMKIYIWDAARGFTDEIELNISLDTIMEDDYLYECWGNNLVNQDDLETYLLYIKRHNNKTEKKESSCGNEIYSALLK